MRTQPRILLLFVTAILLGVISAVSWQHVGLDDKQMRLVATAALQPERPLMPVKSAMTDKALAVRIAASARKFAEADKIMQDALLIMPEAHIHRRSTLPLKSAITDKALAVRIAVSAGKFAEADKIMQDSLSISKFDGFGSFQPFDDLVGQLQQKDTIAAFNRLDDWVHSDKDSPFPYLARAQFLLMTGWTARGNGSAAEATAEGMKTFETNLAKALPDLIQSIKLNDRIPISFQRLLEILREIGSDENAYNRIFDHAASKFPDSYPIFKEGFRRRTPKWGGSIPELSTFVDESLKNVREDSPLRLLQQDLYFSLVKDMWANCGGDSTDGGACEKAVGEILNSKGMEAKYKDTTQSLEKAHPVAFNEIMMNTYLSSDSLVASPFTKQALDWQKEVLGDNNYAVDFGYGSYYYLGMHSHGEAFKYYNKALSEVEAFPFSNEEDRKVALGKIYGVMAASADIENNFEQAVEFDNKAIAQDNTVSLYYKRRCQTYFSLKNYENALNDCNEAIALGAPREVYELLHQLTAALYDQTHPQH